MLTDEELRKFFMRSMRLSRRRGRLCGTSLCRKFSAPVRMWVSCPRSAETTCSRCRPPSSIITVRQGKFRKDRWFLRIVLGEPIAQYADHFGSGRPKRSSSRDRAEGPSPYEPFTHFFVSCCCSVGFPRGTRQRPPNPRLSAPIRPPYVTTLVSRR